MQRWGQENEETARQAYFAAATHKHEGLTIHLAGLFLDPECSFIGASPDALVCCECCGQGTVELKCPFTVRDSPLRSTANLCLTETDGKWMLQRDHAYYYQVGIGQRGLPTGDHAYYYQVQMQIHVCRVSYCDFVVWTPQEMAVERIHPDPEFMREKLENVSHFLPTGFCRRLSGNGTRGGQW